MTKLIIMSGMPGSGKSTYAKALANKYTKEGKTVHIISSDLIRESLGGRQDFTHEKEVWAMFTDFAIDYADEPNAVVIMDATFLTNRKRYKYALFFKHYYRRIELVVMDTAYSICLARNRNRKADEVVPAKVMSDMLASFEPIDRTTCFSYFYKVESVKS